MPQEASALRKNTCTYRWSNAKGRRRCWRPFAILRGRALRQPATDADSPLRVHGPTPADHQPTTRPARDSAREVVSERIERRCCRSTDPPHGHDPDRGETDFMKLWHAMAMCISMIVLVLALAWWRSRITTDELLA